MGHTDGVLMGRNRRSPGIACRKRKAVSAEKIGEKKAPKQKRATLLEPRGSTGEALCYLCKETKITDANGKNTITQLKKRGPSRISIVTPELSVTEADLTRGFRVEIGIGATSNRTGRPGQPLKIDLPAKAVPRAGQGEKDGRCHEEAQLLSRNKGTHNSQKRPSPRDSRARK